MHVLAAAAAPLRETHERLAPHVTERLVEEVVGLVPRMCGCGRPAPGPDAARAAYVEHLTLRLTKPDAWLGDAA